MPLTDEQRREAMRELGRKGGLAGGKKGGSAGRGAAKRRSPEHYARLVEIRRENRARREAEERKGE